MHLKIRGMVKIYEGCFVKREGSYFWLIFWCYCCVNEFLPFWILLHHSSFKRKKWKQKVHYYQTGKGNSKHFYIWKDSCYFSESSNFENVRKMIQKAFFILLFSPQDISLFFNAILKGFLQYSKNVLKYISHKNHVVSNVLDGRVHLVSCGRGSLRESRKFSFINWGKRRATFGANREKCFMPSYSSLHSSFIFV